jgi:hypothetical protein
MEPKANDDTPIDWAVGQVSSLGLPAGWEPDAGRAFGRLRRRNRGQERRRKAIWTAAAVGLSCVVLLTVPGVRNLVLRAQIGTTGADLTPTAAPHIPAAEFDPSDRLHFPSGYRNWVYVGSSLGLGYSETGGPARGGQDPLFHNVYIDPTAYARYSETGEFPEGTVMILEVASSASKNEPGLQGTYQDQILGIEASVKDSSRFGGGWAYFSFTERSGRTREIAEAFPEESCWTCHDDHAETDHVFTQFYPVLSAVFF